jgi:hypothetical protein
MSKRIFEIERKGRKLKLDVVRASRQGLWFSIYKTDYSKCLDFYMTNGEAIEFIRFLNKDLNIFEDARKR